MFLVLLLAACAPITQETFPDAFAEAICDRWERCGQTWPEEAESCEAYALESQPIDEYSDDENWDDATAAACIDWLRLSSCEETTADGACWTLYGEE